MINRGRWQEERSRRTEPRRLFIALLLSGFSLLLLNSPAIAQEALEKVSAYRTFLGADSRTAIWIIAQLHLMFAAFVLGVPIFAVIVEAIGVKRKDDRYDRMAKEFTKLLAAAFSTTAALGGLMAFILFGSYPRFMGYMSGVFQNSMYIYALLFFAEGFTLYLYYYSWDRLANHKWLHISIGIFLNIFGTALMFIANSWSTFMMSPTGVDKTTGELHSAWEAFTNTLWMPLNIHRVIANVSFGGFIVGAYAAAKFLGSGTDQERAHYDWMGYTGNLLGIAALIPLPFAGYYLGRELYSASPLMGNIMMGGTFSWIFVIQAVLVGILFIGGNYYLWLGMERIQGAERYAPYIKYINAILFVCLAIWLVPHNMPLSGEERALIGEQYHPVLKYLGLMSAKNAAVQFVIISTFVSFLLYRRANKEGVVSVSQQGAYMKGMLALAGGASIALLFRYLYKLAVLDPASLDLASETSRYLNLPMALLIIQMGIVAAGVALTLKDRGKLAQAILVGVTVVSAVGVLGVYGFTLMVKANPFLRNLAVVQVLLVLTCLLTTLVIDLSIFRGAREIGGMLWGRMTVRSQYVLVLLCVTVVLLMGLMGYLRSAGREEWHIYELMKDTSPGAYTPTMAQMSRVVGVIVAIFLTLVTFVFWLSALGEKKAEAGPESREAPTSSLAGD